MGTIDVMLQIREKSEYVCMCICACVVVFVIYKQRTASNVALQRCVHVGVEGWARGTAPMPRVKKEEGGPRVRPIYIIHMVFILSLGICIDGSFGSLSPQKSRGEGMK